MSVVIETTLGDIIVDLFLTERPRTCFNFLKLCKLKYYNFNLFHTISRGFIAQTGDPTGTRTGGESIYGVLEGPLKRFFEAENEPRIKHTRPGLISFVGGEENMIGSQFFLTLGEDLTYLDEKHCVFGEVVEGFDVLEMINEVICDKGDRPYQDVRITHTVVLDDPYPDPDRLRVPSRSPSPSAERLAGGRIAPDEEVDETSGKTSREVEEMQAEREAKARATILEMVGDIPDADIAPPENVLFVCKLNPVTTDDDLEIIFSRFGNIKSCEVIRDRKSGDSLQYAFIEFDNQKSCEDAYFKMSNVLIDDRRIHVDFSQSVSKVKWLGKGRGVAHYDGKGNKSKQGGDRDIGRGDYKVAPERRGRNSPNGREVRRKERSRSPRKTRKRSKTPASRDERYRDQYRDSRRSHESSRYRRRLDEVPHRSVSSRYKNDNYDKTRRSPRRDRSPRRRSRSRGRHGLPKERTPEKRFKDRRETDGNKRPEKNKSESVSRQMKIVDKPKKSKNGKKSRASPGSSSSSLSSDSEEESDRKAKLKKTGRNKKDARVQKTKGKKKKRSRQSSSDRSSSSSESDSSSNSDDK